MGAQLGGAHKVGQGHARERDHDCVAGAHDDVKIQIEFDPKQVASYRLIGYENRALAAKDFNDDRKDAGEIGAGHSVTALYELISTKQPDAKQPVAELRLRYKTPQGSKSELLRVAVVDSQTGLSASSNDFRFAAAVAEFAMLLRKSAHSGTASSCARRSSLRGRAGALVSTAGPSRADDGDLERGDQPAVPLYSLEFIS